MPKKAALTRQRKKARIGSTAVCFGTLNREEWHVDFSLLPKDVRYYASLKFVAVAKSPHVYKNVIFVYDRTLGTVSVRKQLSPSVDIGDRFVTT